MRNLNKNGNIKSLAENEKLPLNIVQLDVTDEESVKNAIRSIITEAKRIDVLVNNAGYALNRAFEDETNLFGLTRVTQATIPVMRKQKSGTIINISSGVVTIGA
jgi:NADP-dependent 3-hydroxy acid dehydrogenase YdfG